MVPHSLKMYKISDEVINFIDKTMKTWRVELTPGRTRLVEANILRGIFQWDTLSPLLFLTAMMTLNHILRKCSAGYKLSRSQEKVNHLLYMDDIKLFAKNEKELETLIHTVRIYSWVIGIEFDIEKCAILVMKSGKRQLTDGMELPNKDKIKKLAENETYKYLGILEADTIKQAEMKEKIQKEHLRRTRKLLETKLNSRNLIKGINTWAVSLVRYSGPFLKWTRCGDTPLRPTHTFITLLTIRFFTAGDQLVVPRGVTHISCHYKNTIEGTGENRTNEQTRTICLGVNSRAKRGVMQHYISDSIYGLTLAWITSENSTKQLECRHIDSVFFAGPYIMLPRLSARVSTVDRLCPCPVANSPCAPLSNQLSSRVPLPLPDPPRFQVQKPFVWFRAKTDKGIVSLVGHLHSVTQRRT